MSGEQLLQLPYVQAAPTDGRVVSLQAFFDHTTNEWHLYLPVSPGKLGRIAGGETVSGSYFAAGPEDPTRDIELPLGTLITQHLSFSEVLHQLGKLESDVHRCAAILEKYHLLWSTRGASPSFAPLLVQSELEYLLFLLRALYDVMQGVVREVTRRLIFLDGSGRRAVQDMPGSFRDVALKAGQLRSLEQIQNRWGMPQELAMWYFSEAPFFRVLRDMRDAIAHQGANPPTVFETEWGFAIDPAVSPWNQLDEWPPERRWQGRLGSLRAVFAGFIVHSIQSTSRFASVISGIVELPPAILKDVKFFVRSPFGARLVLLEAMRAQPWEGLESQ